MTLGNDNGTDGQTDGETDRVRRNMRPPPREEGRITMRRECVKTVDRLRQSLHATPTELNRHQRAVCVRVR